MLEEGRVATIIIDPYLVTESEWGLGNPYSDTQSVEYTGWVHWVTPGEIVRLEVSQGSHVLFHADDATVLTGPSRG